ncbi:MAG: hypothetical protein WD017_01690 [Cucumibacter sp.]
MTTIAYRSGILAADRLVTSNNTRAGRYRKIVRSAAGHLAGASGELHEVDRFLKWVAAGCEGDPPVAKGKVNGLLIYPTGRVVEWEGLANLVDVRAPFYATGSGWELALGAMEMGADARRAVEVAIKFDANSGGGIDVLKLRKKGRG